MMPTLAPPMRIQRKKGASVYLPPFCSTYVGVPFELNKIPSLYISRTFLRKAPQAVFGS